MPSWKIKLHLNSEVDGISGYAGNYASQIKPAEGDVIDVNHGAIIIATGAQNYKPAEYLYGEDKRIITQHELQKQIADGSLENVSTVVMIPSLTKLSVGICITPCTSFRLHLGRPYPRRARCLSRPEPSDRVESGPHTARAWCSSIRGS